MQSGTIKVKLNWMNHCLMFAKNTVLCFSQALPPQKIDIFFKSEKEFGHFVQEEMKQRQLKKQMRMTE